MFSWKIPPKRPILVAHRGASAIAPENTLAAFQRAIDQGADAVELDVRLTADGEVVVFHDGHLRRTTNGNGKVDRCSLAELKQLSAGEWFSRSFAAERIPTLDEVMELLPAEIGINVEMKAGLRNRRRSNIVQRCCSILRNHGAESNVLVSSFYHPFLREVRRLLPSSVTGLLLHPLKRGGNAAIRKAVREGATYLIVGGGTLRRGLVHGAHEHGLLIGEFTVNTDRRFTRALRYGVDAMFSDDPRRFARRMAPAK